MEFALSYLVRISTTFARTLVVSVSCRSLFMRSAVDTNTAKGRAFIQALMWQNCLQWPCLKIYQRCSLYRRHRFESLGQ